MSGKISKCMLELVEMGRDQVKSKEQWKWLAFETMLSSGAYTQEWGTVIWLDAWQLVISESCRINKLLLAEISTPLLISYMSMPQWKQTYVLATDLCSCITVSVTIWERILPEYRMHWILEMVMTYICRLKQWQIKSVVIANRHFCWLPFV